VKKSELSKELVGRGVRTHPAWARGATVLVEGLTPEALPAAGLEASDLRPWNVVVKTEDCAKLRSALLALRSSLPYRKRPRVVDSKSKEFVVRLAGSCEVGWRSGSAGLSPRLALSHSAHEAPETPCEAAGIDWKGAAGSVESVSDPPSDNDEAAQEEVTEEPARIDRETAACMAREQRVSFLESRGSSGFPVRGTFIDYPASGRVSPRSIFTA